MRHVLERYRSNTLRVHIEAASLSPGTARTTQTLLKHGRRSLSARLDGTEPA